MKVVLLSTMCGPRGTGYPGTVLDVSDDEGRQLLQGLHARPYDEKRDAKARRGLQQAPQRAGQAPNGRRR